MRNRLPLGGYTGRVEELDGFDPGNYPAPDPGLVDPAGGVSSGTGGVSTNPVGRPIEWNPTVAVPSGPQTAPGPVPVESPVYGGPSAPPLPEVPAGPIPGMEESFEPDVPLAPPPPATATGLPTFGVGGNVSPGLRSPTFRSNRVVGGGAGDVLLKGITQRFGPGIAQAEAPLPSGLGGDTGGNTGAFTDEDLLKRSIMGRR